MISGGAAENVYFHTPGVASVRWDQSAESVLVEWEGWANSTEFKTLLDAGVRALTEHRGSRWLADCRLQKVLNPEDQAWGDREWVPRVMAAGLQRFAVVLPTSVLAAMNLQDRFAVLSMRLEVGYFTTVDEAKEWLAK